MKGVEPAQGPVRGWKRGFMPGPGLSGGGSAALRGIRSLARRCREGCVTGRHACPGRGRGEGRGARLLLPGLPSQAAGGAGAAWGGSGGGREAHRRGRKQGQTEKNTCHQAVLPEASATPVRATGSTPRY